MVGQTEEGLLEKYRFPERQGTMLVAWQKIIQYQPKWEELGLPQGKADNLKLLQLDAKADKTKAIILGHEGVLEACFAALAVKDDEAVAWMITLMYELLREDSSCYNIFETALKANVNIHQTFIGLMAGENTYVNDKSAWILSSIIAHLPRFFSEKDVRVLVQKLTAKTDNSTHFSSLGVLEALTNLLKSDVFRRFVWQLESELEVRHYILGFDKQAPSPQIYKCVFAIWLLSFDKDVGDDLKNSGVIKKLRDILSTNRVEKVVRICLTALKNLMASKGICEEVVECGMHDVIASLEYEKWREAELYEEIRDLATHIANELAEMSTFDSYERELQTGTLRWGFLHTSKFWNDNFMKFEQNDFRAVKALSAIISSSADNTTLAVACHDLGEFVTLHPLGKKKVAQLNTKEPVMKLMGKEGGDEMREVRREALLCCQKIMLNKWQDVK